MTTPNTFNLVHTVFDRTSGETYEIQLNLGRVFDTEQEARQAGEADLVEARGYQDDGRIAGSGRFWQIKPVAFRVHAFHRNGRPHFAPPPMQGFPGPDEDIAEITDIPRAWERTP